MARFQILSRFLHEEEVEEDNQVFIDQGPLSMVQFTMEGPPVPMPRPRVACARRGGRRWAYNPANPAKVEFANRLRGYIGQALRRPFFDHRQGNDQHAAMAVAITFRIRCPTAHFVCRDRSREIRRATMDAVPTDEELFSVGWAKALDPKSGSYYYFTLDRQKIVWDNPLATVGSADSADASSLSRGVAI